MCFLHNASENDLNIKRKLYMMITNFTLLRRN